MNSSTFAHSSCATDPYMLHRMRNGGGPAGAGGFAVTHANAPQVHLMLPKDHAPGLVPNEGGVLEPHVPSMRAL